MKIVTDTNIWYLLEKHPNALEALSAAPLAVNFINLLELARTQALAGERKDYIARVIRILFNYNSALIELQPLDYIARLCFGVDPVDNAPHWAFEMTARLASGETIRADAATEFRKLGTDSEEGLRATFCGPIHASIERIKKLSLNDSDLSYATVSLAIEIVENLLKSNSGSNQEFHLENDSLEKLELMINVFSLFLRRLVERPGKKCTPHDFYDIFILAYVQPGDLFWTRETQLIEMITIAGAEESLYDEGTLFA